MKPLRVVSIGDERDGNKRNVRKKRGLLVWSSLRLREHLKRSELQQVRRAPRQRGEQRASAAAHKLNEMAL
jgi:hypothetical protein